MERYQNQQQYQHRSHTPRGAPLGATGLAAAAAIRVPHAASPSPLVVRIKPEEANVGRVERRDPADEEEEGDGGGEKKPVDLLLCALHHVLVGEGPRDGEEEEDDEEDEEDWVWERGEREGIKD